MPSVTKTGTCLRPSCTAMVCPIMSGMIVERRDHVLITVFLPDSLSTSTFLSRWSSTNGPFFRLRGIGYLNSSAVWVVSHTVRLPCSALLAGAPAADDQLVTRLAPTGATFRLTGRVHRV